MLRDSQSESPPPPYERAHDVFHSVEQDATKLSGISGWVQDTFRSILNSHQKSSLPKLSTYDKLKLVEIHNLELVLCSSCEVIHRRPVARKCYNIGGDTCAANKQCVVLASSRYLRWWEANLFMRAQRLPLVYSTEGYEGFPYSQWCRRSWHYCLVANAVNNRPLLRITAVTRLRLDDMVKELEDIPRCRHLEESERLRAAIKETTLQFAATGACWKLKVCSTGVSGVLQRSGLQCVTTMARKARRGTRAPKL